MRAYLKALVPALGTLIAVVGLYISTGEFDRSEIAVGTTGVIASSLAYFTANVPGWPYLKALVPALTTGVAVVGLLIETGEFNRTEFSVLITGLLSASLTYVVRNGEPVDVPLDGADEDPVEPVGMQNQ